MTAPLPTYHGASLGAALGVATPSAGRRIVRREGIPHVFIGRTMHVRVEALEEWLRQREERTEAPKGPAPVPTPPAWARDLLKRGRRRGLTASEARRRAGGAS